MILPEETEYMTYVAFTSNTMVFLSVHVLELVCGMTCLDSSGLKVEASRQGWLQPVRSHVLFCEAVYLSSSSAADFCIAQIWGCRIIYIFFLNKIIILPSLLPLPFTLS